MSDINFDDLEGNLNEGGTRSDKRNTVEWSNPCPKCHGTGKFRHLGPCFTCKGKGVLTFKTAPEQRAKARANAQDRKARNEASAIEAFIAAYPVEHKWMVEQRERFDFAAKMFEAVKKYGSLTPGQLGAVQRCIEKAKTRIVERAAKAEQGKAVDVSRIETIFANARKAALKKPTLRVGEITLRLASANSSNPGAIYVMGQGQMYLGKIMGGTYSPSREATPEDIRLVEETARNPLELAIAYGKRTGNCSCCGRTLSDPESIAAGIGPICAGKWGM